MGLRAYLAIALAVMIGVVAGGLILQAVGVIGDDDSSRLISEDTCDPEIAPWMPGGCPSP